MIILNCKDGLGNQMFEYGFAKFLKKVCGEKDKIVINNYFFENGKRRNYSLFHFELDDTVTVLSNFKQKITTAYFILRLFSCYPKVAFKWFFSHSRPYDEDTFAYSSKKGMYVNFNTFHRFDISPSKAKMKFIYGNYENYSYIEPVLDDLRKEFTVKTEPSEENKKVLERLNSCESVCVHIRRGDYLDPQWAMLNVCDFDYYQKGMDELQSCHPNAKFFIFSNTHEDIEWIKENYHFKQEVEYIDLNNPDYEELRLMRACHHFVISNSTFSWWASVLAERDYKTVVVPERWVLETNSPTDQLISPKEAGGLYLPEWIKISTKKIKETK